MRRISPTISSLLMLGLVWVSLTATALAQTVVQHPDTTQTLQERWQWAQQEAAGEAVIAWRFSSDLDEKLHFNALSAFEHGIGWSRGISFDALLAGKQHAQESFLRTRELLVLAHVRDGDLLEIDVVDSSDIRHWSQPVYWLGKVDAIASYRLMAGLLDPLGHAAANRGLIQALALHSVNERTALLYSLYNTAQWADYRLLLLAALAQQVSPESGTLLLEIAADESADLRERRLAASVLRSFGDEDSLQLLLRLSSDGQPTELRREAIESLAWFTPERVTAALNQIAWFDSNQSLREEAVASLARLYSADADTLLLALAKEHPSAATREEAMTRLQRKLF